MSSSVLIVDDNRMVRKVVRHFLETLPDWNVGGEAEEGAEAIQKETELKPDLILLDFSMPNMNGVEAVSVLKKMLPEVHIIVFTIFDDALGSSLISAVGVDLIVPKTEGPDGIGESRPTSHETLAAETRSKNPARRVTLLQRMKDLESSDC
jgi:DNA-binding NarL/FixJ family response regulator